MSDNENQIGFAQLGLGSVLKQNRLAVHAYQREYAWESKEVTTLFKDFSREIGEGSRVYFLGTVVTIPKKDGVLEVVDGQQRLATTAILLASFRNYLAKSEAELAASIESDFLTVFNRNTRTRVPRLQLNLDDNEYFRSKINGTKPEASKSSHRLIDSAFSEAESHVRNIVKEYDVKDHGSVVNRWLDFIEHNASVILLRVPNATNAYRMFETLNDRGKRVGQSDLVKSYLYGQTEERLEEVQQKWAYMRGALDSMEEEEGTIEFLRHALTLVRGFTRSAEVYEATQNHAKGEQPVVTFVTQLELLANAYVAVHMSDHERWNKFSDSARRAIEVLNLFDIKVMWPLVLAVVSKFSDRDIQKSLNFCVSLGVRLMIGNRTRTGTVEEGLADAAHKVFRGDTANLDQLEVALKAITPTDGQFRASFAIASVTKGRLSRYYLRSLEMQVKEEPEPWHIPNDDKTAINLEHVLPERPEGNWPQFTDDEVKIYRNRIGNYVLLRASENSHLKSAPFLEKKAVYESCPYELTKQASEAADWTSQVIEERQSVLADLALKTWKLRHDRAR